jgi:hypothetical protein
MQIMEGQKRVVLFIHPKHHAKLMEMSLNRSAELGTRVSMGFIVEELLDREEQMDNPEKRSADLFGSQE